MFKETLEADAKILRKYGEYIRSLDPIVGNIASTRKFHSGGVIYRSEQKKLAIPLGKMSAEVSVKVKDVFEFNLEKTCTDIYEFAESFLRDMTQTMFSTLSQVTDFTGNVIDGKGNGITHEMLLEMLEKIYIDFDQDGNPLLPSIIIHPDMAKAFEKLKSDEDIYKGRVEEIITKKREAYYAEKGHRGLSRID